MTQARGVQGRLLRSSDVETAYNLDPTSMTAIVMPFNTADLRGDQTQITPATIRGRRDPAQPILGRVNVAGSIVVPVDRFTIGHWLKMALGAVSVASTGGDLFQHTFTVGSLMDSYVMELGYTDIAAYAKYNGCKVGGMNFSIGGDEEFTMSFDIVGGKETVGTTTAFSGTTELGLARYNQFDATLKEGGSTLATVTECNITVNNNLDESVYLIDGEPTRAQLPEGFINVTGSYRAMFENWSLYAYAFSGTERSLELDFAVGSDQMQIIIDEIQYRRQAPGIPTPGGIWITQEFQAYYDDAAAASVIRAILINSLDETTY